MSRNDIAEIAEKATMIVCGYAFIKMDDGNCKVVGLKEPFHASVMCPDGEILETSMDDIELSIVKGYWVRNRKYMEEEQYA